MPRFNAEQVDNYGGNGGSGFFSLKDDKDTARVRFMYNGLADIEGVAVHQVEVDGKKRYVNCLREYGQPLDTCPFCAAKQFQVAKLFVPVYDIDSDQIKIWERGKKFFGELTSLCSRYSSANSPLVAQVFDIERRGKKGDTSTTYGIYPVGNADNTTFDDLPDVPEIIGGIVLDKTANEMQYYLNNGEFPGESAPANSGRGYRDNNATSNAYPQRRTPAGNGDRF